MKQTIYLIAIIIMFAACKQNFTTKEASEAITEEIATSPAIVDSATTVVPQQTIVVEQPKETSKLDLPFVGKRNFAFTDGVVNDNFITINKNNPIYNKLFNYTSTFVPEPPPPPTK